ncbi:hypothetical protein KHA96_11670 [Bacillus sp. FJAT-49711]|uniref:hypothetical protein n=1 Tax=Bacillus sp. FJAT-49711 TaxID=2833585 RepID=UPI001BCA1920|nr:hypothetical protein [Bacillus sp. FJAT-49711]MBS4218974.1 hypothetical protein [Bacillus sp. FJAT-49711]
MFAKIANLLKSKSLEQKTSNYHEYEEYGFSEDTFENEYEYVIDPGFTGRTKLK